MKNKLSKFFLMMLMVFGAVGLTSCEKASHSAEVPTSQCDVRIIQDTKTQEKTALVTLGIKNDTIFNISAVEIAWDAYMDTTPLPDEGGRAEVPVVIRHGLSGYLTYTVTVDKTSMANYVKITEAKVTKYQTLFQTYLVPFIVMFTLAGLALLFFCIELFGKGLTKEMVKDMFKEKLASTLVILAMTLLICLIPLMFSGWVITLILLGGFVGTSLLCGLLTLIRMGAAKN